MPLIRLPMPPSVNAAYRNVPRKGRVKTKAHLAWQKEAIVMLRQQRPEPVPGCEVAIQMIFGPRNRRRDLDNMLKLPLDLLVSEGLIDDDSCVAVIAAEWDDDVIGCVVDYWGRR